MEKTKTKNPRLIYEFEGGPCAMFWENPLLFGPEYKSDAMKPIVLEACKDHKVFRDHKITPTLDAVMWEEMPLASSCEECEECSPETCPKPIEEVGEKGSGMKMGETLEGWFIDLGKCTPNIKVIDLAKEGTLLPCVPDGCQECAVDHDPEMPHDQQSLYYQYKFYHDHGRWPTWEDSMSHCSTEVQNKWKHALRNEGILI